MANLPQPIEEPAFTFVLTALDRLLGESGTVNRILYCWGALYASLACSRVIARTLKCAKRFRCDARGADSTKLPKLECVHTLKGLALPCVSHSGEIALAGSRRLRSTLAVAPVLFVHAVATVAKNEKFQPTWRYGVALPVLLVDVICCCCCRR